MPSTRKTTKRATAAAAEADSKRQKKEEHKKKKKTQKETTTMDDDEEVIADWIQTKVKPNLLCPGMGLCVTLYEESNVDDAKETGFGDDFQFTFLSFGPDVDQRDGLVEVDELYGPGRGYGKMPFEKAAKQLLDDYRVVDETLMLYVFSAAAQDFDRFAGDPWEAFVEASRHTNLPGPWTKARLVKALSSLQELVVSLGGEDYDE